MSIISTIKFNINSIVNSGMDETTFDSTYPRKKLRILIDINISGGTSITFIAAHTSSDVIIHNIYFLSTDETVGTNNDNSNTSTTSTNCNNTRYAELLSEYGERVMPSFGCNYTSIGIAIGINTLSWHSNYIHTSCCVNNKNATCDASRTLLNVYNNNICETLIGYDWTRDTIGIGRVSGKHSTSILLYRAGILHNSEMIYDVNNMTASLHNDGDIEDHTHQDGEHRIMSMHISGFDLESDSMTAKYNILSLENDDVYRNCKVKDHVNNTQCDDDRFTLECKNIRVVNGTYKCTGNTTYNSLAIRTGSWIVLIMSYTHTTLHQLESNEHKTVCSRLDGRGVTNVEHLHI